MIFNTNKEMLFVVILVLCRVCRVEIFDKEAPRAILSQSSLPPFKPHLQASIKECHSWNTVGDCWKPGFVLKHKEKKRI